MPLIAKVRASSSNSIGASISYYYEGTVEIVYEENLSKFGLLIVLLLACLNNSNFSSRLSLLNKSSSEEFSPKNSSPSESARYLSFLLAEDESPRIKSLFLVELSRARSKF